MQKLVVPLLLVLICSLSAQVEKKEVLLLMGSRFEINVVSQSEALAAQQIQVAIAEIKRIEAIISSWDAHSETSGINRNAGIKAISVSPELFELIQRAIKISELTKGAFDITAVVMTDIWKFDGSMTSFPKTSIIEGKKKLIDYNNIILNEKDHSVFLKKKGMRIGFGSIGKGYAAQSTANLLKNNGINSGLINAGGDLYAWGTQADNTPWQIGIVDPQNKEKTYAWLDINNRAIVTSGDYEKTVVFNGVSYSHIIDPRTASPVSNGLHSVTIICNNAELADALATGVFVLGEEVGLYLINQLEGVEVILVNEKKKILTSQHIELNPVKRQ